MPRSGKNGSGLGFGSGRGSGLATVLLAINMTITATIRNAVDNLMAKLYAEYFVLQKNFSLLWLTILCDEGLPGPYINTTNITAIPSNH